MFTKAYRRYVLGVLTSVVTLNFVDRVLVGLLLQPIQDDLHLSDTQLGFLTGIAFALFYATLGLPIARWADRGNRVTLTSIAIALWAAAVMLCLSIANFFQLIGARIAAAIGEAGCMPPTYSLVGDYFPGPAQRARAMAFYWLANPLAGILGFVVGGWLNQRYGWRQTFALMGLPAVFVAILVKLTVVEPRSLQTSRCDARPRAPDVGEVLRSLWRQRSCRNLILAIVLLMTMALGLAPWYAALMIRVHGMSTGELGTWLGLIFGLGGIVGNLLSGHTVARWLGNDEPGQMRLSAVSIASLVPCLIVFLLVPQKVQALLALIPLVIAINFFQGPAFALLQRLVVDEMRATTLAVVMLLANLIGMGLGPQLIGIFSDLLRPLVGVDSLRYAMLAISVFALWAAYHFWQVARTVKDDLATVTQAAPRHRDDVLGTALEPNPTE